MFSRDLLGAKAPEVTQAIRSSEYGLGHACLVIFLRLKVIPRDLSSVILA